MCDENHASDSTLAAALTSRELIHGQGASPGRITLYQIFFCISLSSEKIARPDTA